MAAWTEGVTAELSDGYWEMNCAPETIPDMILLLTQCLYHGDYFVFAAYDSLNKPFDIFPPDWRMLRRSRRVPRAPSKGAASM